MWSCRVEGQEDFHTVMPPPALLGKDASYWQSVHQAGQSMVLERQEAARKEKEAWQAKASSIAELHERTFGSLPTSACLCSGSLLHPCLWVALPCRHGWRSLLDEASITRTIFLCQTELLHPLVVVCADSQLHVSG